MNKGCFFAMPLVVLLVGIATAIVIYGNLQIEKLPTANEAIAREYRHKKPFRITTPTYSKTFSIYSNRGRATEQPSTSTRGYYGSAVGVLNYEQNHYLGKIKNLSQYHYHISNSKERTHLLGDHYHLERTIQFTRK